jgi:hypothetical protein
MRGKNIMVGKDYLQNILALNKLLINQLPILDIDNNRWIRKLVDIPEGQTVYLKEGK